MLFCSFVVKVFFFLCVSEELKNENKSLLFPKVHQFSHQLFLPLHWDGEKCFVYMLIISSCIQTHLLCWSFQLWGDNVKNVFGVICSDQEPKEEVKKEEEERGQEAGPGAEKQSGG